LLPHQAYQLLASHWNFLLATLIGSVEPASQLIFVDLFNHLERQFFPLVVLFQHIGVDFIDALDLTLSLFISFLYLLDYFRFDLLDVCGQPAKILLHGSDRRRPRMVEELYNGAF
jgi:hypothetical protein